MSIVVNLNDFLEIEMEIKNQGDENQDLANGSIERAAEAADSVACVIGREFDDWSPFVSMRIAAGEYEIRSKSGAISFEVFGAAFADWICLKLNARADDADSLPSPIPRRAKRAVPIKLAPRVLCSISRTGE